MNMNDMVAAMMDKDYTEDQIKSAVDAAIAKERIKRESEKTKAATNVDKLRHDAAIAAAKYLHAALPNYFDDSEDNIKLYEESLREIEAEFKKSLDAVDEMVEDLHKLRDIRKFLSGESVDDDENDDDILDNFLRHLS